MQLPFQDDTILVVTDYAEIVCVDLSYIPARGENEGDDGRSAGAEGSPAAVLAEVERQVSRGGSHGRSAMAGSSRKLSGIFTLSL
jgi:hypothetical protein